MIYTDCSGDLQNYELADETLIFCARGSVGAAFEITLTNNGNCNISCSEYNTDGSSDVYYMDCLGNPQIITIGTVTNFCAANGTVVGTGTIIVATPCTL